MAAPDKSASAGEILSAAKLLNRARYAIALTGAGMSVESGIPPFRGPGGLWTKYGEPPMNGFERFMADPKKAWEERLSRRNDELFKPLQTAAPNPGHRALVQLEEIGAIRLVITQNIDDLHRRAGQKSLAEIHGNCTLPPNGARRRAPVKRPSRPTHRLADLLAAVVDEARRRCTAIDNFVENPFGQTT
ncbi:MAG: SIR2 family NAD-dependent protein deacylase [Candidatus Binataceae bacterium]